MEVTLADYIAWIRTRQPKSRSEVVPGKTRATTVVRWVESCDLVYPFSAKTKKEINENLRVATSNEGSRGTLIEYRILKVWEVSREIKFK